MSQQFEQLKLTHESPAYWRVTFDHPPINLLDDNTMPDLERLLDLMQANKELKVVVFDSANPDFFIAHFSPAAGVKKLTTLKPNGLFPWADFVDRFAKVPVVTIAALRGRARGGGAEFALACDIRFASLEKAILAQIEVGSGLFPGGGALERLPRLIGRARALEVILGSDDYDAATAERYCWVNRAIPDDKFVSFVDSFARRVASFDKQALTETKRLLDLRNAGPSAADFHDTQKLFFGALSWPGAAARIPKLIKLGAGQYGDWELNYGRRLNELGSSE
jgi:enoyl-CoA hydratase/carnithine racemase